MIAYVYLFLLVLSFVGFSFYVGRKSAQMNQDKYLEQLTDFELSHVDAVGVGVALDTIYSWKTGRLDESSAMRILAVLKKLKLPTWHESFEMRTDNGTRSVFVGLEEFREHLGGELTVLLLKDIGKGEDVHTMDTNLLDECIDWLALHANGRADRPQSAKG